MYKLSHVTILIHSVLHYASLPAVSPWRTTMKLTVKRHCTSVVTWNHCNYAVTFGANITNFVFIFIKFTSTYGYRFVLVRCPSCGARRNFNKAFDYCASCAFLNQTELRML